MDFNEIEQQLTDNFNGNQDPYLEMDAYDGDGDLYLDFDGPQNLNPSELEKSRKRFGITINNATTSQKTVAISPAAYRELLASLVYDDSGTLKYKVTGGGTVTAPTGKVADDIMMLYSDVAEINEAGHEIDALIDDGVIYNDGTNSITITSKSKTGRVRHFLNWLKANPTHFIGMHIVCSNSAMFENELTIQKCNPFKKYEEVRIPLQDDNKPSNNNTAKIIVAKEFQMDGESIAKLVIPASTSVEITFVAGVTESAATGLKNKVTAAANKNTALVPVKPIVKKPVPIKKTTPVKR